MTEKMKQLLESINSYNERNLVFGSDSKIIEYIDWAQLLGPSNAEDALGWQDGYADAHIICEIDDDAFKCNRYPFTIANFNLVENEETPSITVERADVSFTIKQAKIIYEFLKGYFEE